MNFSAIVPLYNKEKYINRTLHSILTQTIQNYEIIIVDDGSTDNSVSIVEQINDKRILLIKQNHLGVSAARNNGIRTAKNELIVFLDADDEWKPEFLETILTLVYKFPDAGAYATAYEIVREDGSFFKPRIKAIPSDSSELYIPSYFKSVVKGDPPFCSSSICIPKNVFKKIGLFREDMSMAEDIEMWARIATFYKIAYSNKIMSRYHIGLPESACVNKVPPKISPLIETLLLLKSESNVSREEIKWVNKYIVQKEIAYAKHNIILGDKQTALKFLNSREISLLSLQKMFYRMLMTLFPISCFKIIKKFKRL